MSERDDGPVMLTARCKCGACVAACVIDDDDDGEFMASIVRHALEGYVIRSEQGPVSLPDKCTCTERKDASL